MSNKDNWIELHLGDLADGYRGVSYQPNHLLSEQTDQSVTLLRATNIQNGRLDFGDVQIVPQSIVKQTQKMKIGDIAVCMSNGSKRLVGKSAQFKGEHSAEYTVGAFCAIFRPKPNADQAFVKQLFESEAFQAHIDISLAGSAINNLKNSDVENVPFCVPPKPTQSKIANILQTIDEAIEQTEALIEKYSLVKAGMMHDLFTRGLTPDGRLRPTREEAPDLYKETSIGWIPKEWDWGDLEDYCSRICVGIVIRPADYYVTEGVPTFRSANVRESGITDSDLVYISPKSNAMLHKSQVRKGDILTVRTGYPGTSAVVPEKYDGCNCVDILISTPTGSISSEFLCYWINSSFGKGQVLSGQGGLAQQHFNVGEMRELIVVKPCEDEQSEITKRFDAVEEKIETQQELLKKYKLQKFGLMNDLLTGVVPVKVDNPEVAHV